MDTRATAKFCARMWTSVAIRRTAVPTPCAPTRRAITHAPARTAMWATIRIGRDARMWTSARTRMSADPVPYVRISRAVIAATARRDTTAMDARSPVAWIRMSAHGRPAAGTRIV